MIFSSSVHIIYFLYLIKDSDVGIGIIFFLKKSEYSYEEKAFTSTASIFPSYLKYSKFCPITLS